MPSEIKNSISHRGKALKSLKEYFESKVTANENQSDEPVNKKPRNLTEQTWTASMLILHECIIGHFMYIVYLNIFCLCWINFIIKKSVTDLVFHCFVLNLFITCTWIICMVYRKKLKQVAGYITSCTVILKLRILMFFPFYNCIMLL